jgi:hypothetical protein
MLHGVAEWGGCETTAIPSKGRRPKRPRGLADRVAVLGRPRRRPLKLRIWTGSSRIPENLTWSDLRRDNKESPGSGLRQIMSGNLAIRGSYARQSVGIRSSAVWRRQLHRTRHVRFSEFVRSRRLRWSLAFPKHRRILTNSATRNFKGVSRREFSRPKARPLARGPCFVKLPTRPIERRHLSRCQST